LRVLAFAYSEISKEIWNN